MQPAAASLLSPLLLGMRTRLHASAAPCPGPRTQSLRTPKIVLHPAAQFRHISRPLIGAMRSVSAKRTFASETKTENNTATETKRTSDSESAKAAEQAPSSSADQQPDSGNNKVAALEEQLKAKAEALEELTNQLKYAVADRMNAQKLAKQDIDAAKQFGIQKFAVDMLEVADTLDMALQCLTPAERTGASRTMQEFATGVDMTSRILQKKLATHGITQINPLNEKFDPMKHQALFQIPGTQANLVGAVVKPGYILNGRVIRPAQVGVTMQQQAPAGGDAAGTDSKTNSNGN